ncbi:MAG: hypothetical protein KME45_16670 [Stenomitos rutilans HA7619-LM2]|jgi:hypothetical protein|nr:hypothetical protein [Stenomitos rutilans HA7619-LM2]
MGSSSSHEFTPEANPRLQPCQIVCLEHDTSYLYAEVIQVIESRQLCWARPLVLIQQPSDASAYSPVACNSPLQEQPGFYDLRQDSDLLLPLTLFRAALDTEVFSWMTSLYAADHDAAPNNSPDRGHQPFRQFIQQVWQAHPNAFQNVSA